MPNKSSSPLNVIPGAPPEPKGRLPIVLSVDWTYFLPRSTEEFDWGPARLPELNTWRWQHRAFDTPFGENVNDMEKAAYKLIRIAPKAVAKFWPQVISHHPITHLCICNSHEKIVEFTGGLKAFELINFSAYHSLDAETPELVELDAVNWARQLRASGKLKSYTLVYPRWRKHRPQQEGQLQGVDRLVYGDWPDAPIKPARVLL